MTIERAFRVAHNLDVPEPKRKHWPGWSVVVVHSEEEVADVVQFFEHPGEVEQTECLRMYPKSMSFTVKAGEYHKTLEEFCERVRATASLLRKAATA